MTNPGSRPRVVLVGPPGAGKSTVGRLLSQHWELPFRDTDADIEATTGKTISAIFFDSGEEQFRALESAAVQSALEEHIGVLSLGGGAVLAIETRALLAGHRVVLLNVGLSDAVRRVGLGRDRPVLALHPRAMLRVLLEERLPLYREVADVEVNTDGREPEDIVQEVVSKTSLIG